MLGNVPVFLTIFLALLIAYAIRRAQLDARRQKREKEFWDREEAAKHAPAIDLSTVDYIKVPLDSFPIGEVDDDEIMLIEDELREISTLRMLSIGDKTNTDLKLEYGTSNFEKVTEYGERFNRLLTLLCDYAKGLIEGGREDLAVNVLEYGVDIGSDISANYTLLGDIYSNLGYSDRLGELISKVEASSLLLKDSILRELRSNEGA